MCLVPCPRVGDRAQYVQMAKLVQFKTCSLSGIKYERNHVFKTKVSLL